MLLPGGRSHCQGVGQTVRESGRLSGSRADSQGVGQTLRESGRLSGSRADSQGVGQTVTSVRESGNRFFQWSQPHFLLKSIKYRLLRIGT